MGWRFSWVMTVQSCCYGADSSCSSTCWHMFRTSCCISHQKYTAGAIMKAAATEEKTYHWSYIARIILAWCNWVISTPEAANNSCFGGRNVGRAAGCRPLQTTITFDAARKVLWTAASESAGFQFSALFGADSLVSSFARLQLAPVHVRPVLCQ